jgi:hypothetical protein
VEEITFFSDGLYYWLQDKGHLPLRLIMFTFAGFAWALWTTRNKMAIEKMFPKAPTDVIYVFSFFLRVMMLSMLP